VQSGNSAEVFSDQNLTQQWKIGRRIIELAVLVEKFYLKFCKSCRLGPVPLTLYSVQKEIKKGLGGYLYVQCENLNCGFINFVPYGKTHRHRGKSGKSGMPCFAVNTKLLHLHCTSAQSHLVQV
jgi:RNase P subunit RPR2